MESMIGRAVDLLRRGGVVALPTETVYGLAARIDDRKALMRIFRIKARPLYDPLIVHIHGQTWLPTVCEMDGHLDGDVGRLADEFWPGPLTLILPKKASILPIITADLPTVAVRCPRHPIFRQVLDSLAVPLAAPSANPFGYVSPTSAEDVQRTLADRVDLIVDGGRCEIGLESTILNLSADRPQILRSGAISAADLERVLDRPVDVKMPFKILAPGQLKHHYSPHKFLRLFDQPEEVSVIEPDIALVFLKRPPAPAAGRTFWLSEAGDLDEVAHNLFALIQLLDRDRRFRGICVQRPPAVGIGIAIRDRLQRAAARKASDGSEV